MLRLCLPSSHIHPDRPSPQQPSLCPALGFPQWPSQALLVADSREGP